MKKAINLSVLSSVLFSVAFATAVSAQSLQSLPMGEWRLASYNFIDKVAYPIDKMTITLNVREDGRLGGKSGCNSYGGGYTVEDNKLKLTGMFSTRMACEEMRMSFEGRFLAVLGAADTFSLENGELTITDPKTHSFLRFVEVKKAVPNN
jgi:putative lipoprotein